MRDGAPLFRPRLVWLLSLLLLLAQQGAWLHQLGHAAYSAAVHAQVLAQPADDADTGEPCAACQSFGQVFFSASTSLPQLAFLAPGYLPGAEPHVAVLTTPQPSPRSRGPPSA